MKSAKRYQRTIAVCIALTALVAGLLLFRSRVRPDTLSSPGQVSKALTNVADVDTKWFDWSPVLKADASLDSKTRGLLDDLRQATEAEPETDRLARDAGQRFLDLVEQPALAELTRSVAAGLAPSPEPPTNEIPHLTPARRLSHGYALAASVAATSDQERSRQFAETTIALLVRLGESPSPVEKRSALAGLYQVTQVAESFGREAGDIFRAVIREQVNLDEFPALPQGLRWLAQEYAVRIREDTLRNVVNIRTPPKTHRKALADQVQTSLRQLADAWTAGDADRVRQIVRDSANTDTGPFLSGFDRVYREEQEWRATIMTFMRTPAEAPPE